MNTPFVVAIDGPTASGKGTLASKIAARLGFDYMDTGALYRGVAKTALGQGLDTTNEDEAIQAAQSMCQNYDLSLQDDPRIRTEAVSKCASEVATIPQVRALLLALQKDFAKRNVAGVVIEGRDIGTVICPDAPVKLFIDASAEIRAERRYKQLKDKGLEADYDAILEQLHIRDGRDSGRKTAPTRAAEDAIILDTSTMSADEVLQKSLQIITDHYTS